MFAIVCKATVCISISSEMLKLYMQKKICICHPFEPGVEIVLHLYEVHDTRL